MYNTENRKQMIQWLAELATGLSDSVENKIFIKNLMEIQGISQEELDHANDNQ